MKIWQGKSGSLRHEHYGYVVRCCKRDEGRPFAVGLQGQAANHLKLLWSKATVVSVEEKAYRICQVWITKVSAERTNARIENF